MNLPELDWSDTKEANCTNTTSSRVSPHFLSSLAASLALYNITKHTQGFSICFIIKNPFNSPRITFNLETNFIFKGNNSVISVLYTLIKHATINQSDP